MKRTYSFIIIGIISAVVVLGFALPKNSQEPPPPIEVSAVASPAVEVVDDEDNVEVQADQIADDEVDAAAPCRGVACYAPTGPLVTTSTVEPDTAASTTDPVAEPSPEPVEAVTVTGGASGDSPPTAVGVLDEVRRTQTITVHLQVVGEATYAVQVAAGSTVEAVMQAAQSDGLRYQTKSFGGMGSYVTVLGGRAEDTQQQLYWILYLNGAKSQTGMSSTVVQDGDSIQWQYEKSY